MTTQALVHSRADRWSYENLAAYRAKTSKRSDATIQKYVSILEQLASENGGKIPPYKWLESHGHGNAYQIMMAYPAAFAHIERDTERKYSFEIEKAHDAAIQKAAKQVVAKPVILPPSKPRSIAEYNISGAMFNPTELQLDSGLTEGEWMAVGRAIATVCQSAHWWVGDLLQYGFRQYGKQISYDLAQQATGYSRTALHTCSYIAKRFPPERRHAALTFFHHQCVAGFPLDGAEELLIEAEELGLTGRQIAQLGKDKYGRRKKHDKRMRVKVFLSRETYDELKERLPFATSPGPFIADIVCEWLAKQKAKEAENGTVMATGTDQ